MYTFATAFVFGKQSGNFLFDQQPKEADVIKCLDHNVPHHDIKAHKFQMNLSKSMLIAITSLVTHGTPYMGLPNR